MKRRKTPPRPRPRRRLKYRYTTEELRAFALGIHRQQIWTDRHCRSVQEIEQTFPILGLLSEKLRKAVHERYGKRGLLFEEMRKASPMGINGLPMFFSMKVLSSAEHRIVQERLRALERAEAEALA